VNYLFFEGKKRKKANFVVMSKHLMNSKQNSCWTVCSLVSQPI